VIFRYNVNAIGVFDKKRQYDREIIVFKDNSFSEALLLLQKPAHQALPMGFKVFQQAGSNPKTIKEGELL
jgi:hypothetical protein